MNIKNWLGQLIKKQLNFPSAENTLLRLHRLGFKPRCIFDVGAYRGDFAQLCFQYWPDSEVVCFEVLPDKIAEIRKLAQRYKIEVYETLIGEQDSPGVSFHLAETASSVLQEHQPNYFQVAKFPMLTLDTFCLENQKIPQLLKIDTQGYEHQVLSGSLGILGEVEIILAELNLIDIHREVKLASDVIQLLRENGFVPYDVSELHRRPLDGALWQIDLLFCREKSNFRADKRWGV